MTIPPRPEPALNRRWVAVVTGLIAVVVTCCVEIAVGSSRGAVLAGIITVAGITASAWALRRFLEVSQLSSPSARTVFIAVGDVVRRRLRSRAAEVSLPWVMYSVAWAPLAAWRIEHGQGRVVLLTSSRRAAYTELLAAAQHGFGPLVQMIRPGAFTPAGITDDQGGYLVLPWLSHLLGTHNVDTIMRTTFVAVVAVTVATYPLVIRRLTGSALAALVSPAIVLIAFGFLPADGFYWVPVATTALCLPWLLVFARERSAPLAPLAAISVAAGVTQIFRSGTGFGILAAAFVLCLLVADPWRRKAAGAALVVGMYLAFSTGVIDVAYQIRANRMRAYPINTAGWAGVTQWSDGAGHPFWHTAYIGLGIVKNRYGIRYDDSVAAAYVRRIDPQAPFVSPKYEAILRRRVLHLLTSDPSFIFRAETRKAEDLVADGLSRSVLLLVAAPLAMVLGVGRGRRRRYMLVVAPIFVIAAAPPMVAIPLIDYELPWFGVLGILGAVSACGVIAHVAARLRAAASNPSPDPAFAPLLSLSADLARRRRAVVARAQVAQRHASSWIGARGRFVSRVLGGAEAGASRISSATWTLLSDHSTRLRLRRLVTSRVALLGLALIAAGFLTRGVLDSWRARQFVSPAAPFAGSPTISYRAHLWPLVRHWSVTQLAPLATRPTLAPTSDSWAEALAGIHVRPYPRQLEVTTTATSLVYQLVSPIIALRRGRYVAAVRGEVSAGGLLLGVLDTRADKWIDQKIFTGRLSATWSTMPVSFTLTAPEKVQLILSNWSPERRRSTWLLTQALIARSLATHTARTRHGRARTTRPKHHHAQ